jgi:hypothetical protein
MNLPNGQPQLALTVRVLYWPLVPFTTIQYLRAVAHEARIGVLRGDDIGQELVGDLGVVAFVTREKANNVPRGELRCAPSTWSASSLRNRQGGRGTLNPAAAAAAESRG